MRVPYCTRDSQIVHLFYFGQIAIFIAPSGLPNALDVYRCIWPAG